MQLRRGTNERCALMGSNRPVSLLGISGSIRVGSCSTAILDALRVRLAERGKANITVFGIEQIPLYNGDLDGDTPPAPVLALKRAIQSSDGLVLSSPEYNHGVSGVLKNALDWASRPSPNSCLKGKPVLIMTSSPGSTGGVRAQAQLRETLTSTYARVVITPEIVIPHVFQKMKDGAFIDESSLAFAESSIDALILEASRYGAP
jgi:chromate reductase, NAD(P)H dehydrogenase (quinone)